MEETVTPGNAIVPLERHLEEEWKIAMTRYYIIAPLIHNEPEHTIASVARTAKVTRQTVYRWLNKFLKTRSVSSLLDKDTRDDKGQTRLGPDIEAIIAQVIKDRYMDVQKRRIKKICLEVALECRKAGIPASNSTTIWRRITAINEEQKLLHRYGTAVARNRFEEIKGSFPDADYPLAAVQIDHTKLDILIVDEVGRLPIGRPWITLAIDVYSRMVIGFYISLDPPGFLGTGLCLAHAILPKELWLSRLDVPGEWPCHGIMRSLYMDNAREFRGKGLELACQEYGISINFRPVTQPHYGGHIERLMGTLLTEIHALPGTTFSNIDDRKDYYSEAKACFTLTELENWVAEFFVGVYHRRKHHGIGMSPIARWNEGILGNDQQIGIGIDHCDIDEMKLKLDFLPFEERTVQRHGVSIDGIMYYGDILRKWIHAYNQPHSMDKTKRKFIFKRDPRDISKVYFFDPDTGQYYEIHYRNTSHPSMTIWEHREVLRTLQERGVNRIDENVIFDTYIRLRKIENQAVSSAALAKKRRNQARKQYAGANSITNQFMHIVEPDEEGTGFKYDPNTVYLPFEDIEHDPFNQLKPRN